MASPFRREAHGNLAEMIQQARLVDVTDQEFLAEWSYASAEEYYTSLVEIAAPIQNLMATLSAPQMQEVKRLIIQAGTQYQRGNRCETAVASKHDGFKDFVLDQLSELQGLTCRAMFGGYGLYCDRVFFGIVQKGRLYFKTNATTTSRYRERGMKPFRPNAKQTLKNYYEVPVNVLEDAGELTIWARQAGDL